MNGKTIVVTGIDTNVGKSQVTGLLARFLISRKRSVITGKFVQTGCQGISEDICLHRRLMGMPLLSWDTEGQTCPYCFPYPASPHLASRLAKQPLDLCVLDAAWQTLQTHFEIVLMEGVGGLMVPLTPEITFLDYLQSRQLPCAVVTSPRLGSINHTLLTLDALASRHIPVVGLAYNLHPDALPEIREDTRAYLQSRFPGIPWVDIPKGQSPGPDFSVDFSPWAL